MFTGSKGGCAYAVCLHLQRTKIGGGESRIRLTVRRGTVQGKDGFQLRPKELDSGRPLHESRTKSHELQTQTVSCHVTVTVVFHSILEFQVINWMNNKLSEVISLVSGGTLGCSRRVVGIITRNLER